MPQVMVGVGGLVSDAHDLTQISGAEDMDDCKGGAEHDPKSTKVNKSFWLLSNAVRG